MSGTMITVAPTGAEVNKAEHPQLPTSLAEVAEAARWCAAAGAAVIHVHVRDDATRPTLDLHQVRETIAAIREAADLVVQVSSGGAVSDDESSRLAVLDCGADTASLTCGTVNFGDEVFVNRWPFMLELYRRMRERAIVPEFELFDLGHVDGMKRLLDSEGPPVGGRVHANLVMGVRGGMPGSAFALVAAVQDLPEGATFSATGIGRTALPVMLASLACGGHLRVGMEDTLTFSRGRPVSSNAELVKRAAELAEIAGRPPIPSGEARELLGLSRLPAEAGSHVAAH